MVLLWEINSDDSLDYLTVLVIAPCLGLSLVLLMTPPLHKSHNTWSKLSSTSTCTLSLCLLPTHSHVWLHLALGFQKWVYLPASPVQEVQQLSQQLIATSGSVHLHFVR